MGWLIHVGVGQLIHAGLWSQLSSLSVQKLTPSLMSPHSPGKSLLCTDGTDRSEDSWSRPVLPLGEPFSKWTTAPEKSLQSGQTAAWRVRQSASTFALELVQVCLDKGSLSGGQHQESRALVQSLVFTHYAVHLRSLGN